MQVLPFLAKSIFISGILVSYYWFFLRNRKINSFNRYYLLMTLLASITFPFINLSFSAGESSKFIIPALTSYIEPTIDTGTSGGLTYGNWVVGMYIIISVLFSAIVVYKVWWIYSVRKNYPVEQMGGINFIQTDLKQAPFSFLNNLFWKSSIALNDDVAKSILNHEMVHIRQGHSIDKLIAQVMTCIIWINPFYWIIRKELQVVHEFLADGESVEDGDISSFSEMLLCSYSSGNYLSPAQAYFNSPIKRRVMMIKKPNARAKLRKFASLAIFAGIFIFVSCSPKKEDMTMSPSAENIQEQQVLQEPVAANSSTEAKAAITAHAVDANKDALRINVKGQKSEQNFVLKNEGNGKRTLTLQ